MVEVVMII
jgi:hypothetical protein